MSHCGKTANIFRVKCCFFEAFEVLEGAMAEIHSTKKLNTTLGAHLGNFTKLWSSCIQVNEEL